MIDKLPINPARTIWAGVGFQTGVAAQELKTALLHTLQAHAIHPQALSGVATIDTKHSLPLWTELTQAWTLELKFFSSQELQQISVPHPSALVNQSVQTTSVAEAAALLGAWPGELIVPKQIYYTQNQKGITVALSQTRPGTTT